MFYPSNSPFKMIIYIFFFSVLFMMMAIISYFNFSYLTKKSSITPTINKINWK